jgi:hypothetical protein
MEGYIEKKDGFWCVRWSDIHSFANGTIWTYSKIVNNDTLGHNEGDKVNVEFIIDNNWLPTDICKIIINKPKEKEVFKPFEPKINNRFIVEFPTEVDIEKYFIKSITKPKYHNNTWQNIRINFYDPIDPSTSHRLFNIIDKLRINNLKILNSFKIKTLDPTGVTIEQWVIYVDEILTIDFGHFDYSNDGIQTPYMIIKPSNCILNY